MRKTRLDIALVNSGLCESREKAQRAVMAGWVKVNGQPARKPGQPVAAQDQLNLDVQEKYVSRGGLKLEHALHTFDLSVRDLVTVDLGASTGGFTDCLLQAGAKKVYAVDVGKGQLAWKLRQDPRVIVMEKTNARTLRPSAMPGGFDRAELVVIDCSFISLQKILPAAIALLGAHGKIVALIKPQFEAGKVEADQGRGVITDPAIHQRVLQELEAFVQSKPGLLWRQVTPSPIMGPAGNTEFLVLIEKTG